MSADAVKRWRKNVKIKAVQLFGGKCQNCGYDRCYDALDFHHKNPEEKDFSFGRVIANPISWDRLKVELDKCILVCANCHTEIHKKLLTITTNNSFIWKHEDPTELVFHKDSKHIRERLPRFIFKMIAITGFGGKCGVCSYNRSIASLHFHHLDPSLKKIRLSQAHPNDKNRESLFSELEKCILLCACCHREAHSKENTYFILAPRFNRQILDYSIENKFKNQCPVCDSIKCISHLSCSKKCAGLLKYR